MRGVGRGGLVPVLAFSWGLCAFFPVGLMYLHLLLMLCAIVFSAGLQERISGLRDNPVVPPIAMMLAWTLLVATVGDWYPDSGTRLFHALRVAAVLLLGLMLLRSEARAALAGFLAGAVLAAFLVAAHHVWGLPPWELWRSLLVSRNNFSSGNMITMATASGMFFFLAIRPRASAGDRVLAWMAASGLGLTVVLHAQSRNSQLLLVLILAASVVYRFRSLRQSLAGLLAVLVLAVAAMQFSPTAQGRFAELADDLHVATAQANYGTSVGVRWRMYEEAVSGMVHHPVLGMGLGSWLPHWQSVWASLDQHLPALDQQHFSQINNPHNDFLLAGMETGVPGMLLLLWLMWRYLRCGWQRRSTAGGLVVVMGTAIFLTALVNAPFRDAALGMTLLWLLSASVSSAGVAGRA